MASSAWQVNLFGGFEILAPGGMPVRTPTNQETLLLAILADRIGKQFLRSELVEELWPDVEDNIRRNRFRVLLADVRKMLEPLAGTSDQALVSDRASVTLSSNGCRSDVAEFEKHLQRANQARVPEERATHYKAADEIYAGEFLQGRTETWALGRRAYYARLQALGQFRYSAILEESGDIPAALIQIARSIEADPLREMPRRRAFRLLAEAGEARRAIAEYEEYEQILKLSVGLTPSEELRVWIKELKAKHGSGSRIDGLLDSPWVGTVVGNLALLQEECESPETILDRSGPRFGPLISRLAVFFGSFEESACQAIADITSSELTELVEASVIEEEEGLFGKRYMMPIALRHYAWSRLAEVEADRLRDRHASYFHQLALHGVRLHFSGERQHVPALYLDAENLRMAAEWMIQKGNAESAIDLIGSLNSFSIVRGYQREVLALIQALRANVPMSALETARVDVLEAIHLCFQDKAKLAYELMARALPVLEASGLDLQVQSGRWLLGYAAYLLGDFAQAASLATEPEISLGDYAVRFDAYRRTLLGMALCELGKYKEANEELAAALCHWRTLGDFPEANLCRVSVARISWRRGDLQGAWSQYRQCMLDLEESDDPRGIGYALEGLGRVASDLGDYSQAARLLGAAQRQRDSIGQHRDFADEVAFEEASNKCRRALGFQFEKEWQTGYGRIGNTTAS